MIEGMGILFAVVAAVGWGLYLVPMKMGKNVKVLNYQAMMAVGILLSTIAANLIFGFSFSVTLLGLASGLIWGLGMFLFIKAVDFAGLSLTAPIMISGVILLSFVWGVSLLHEQITSMTMAAGGIGLLILGAFMVSRVHGSGKTKSVSLGLILTALAGAIFGSYVIPLEMTGVPLQDSLFSMSIGILASTWAIFFLMRGSLDFRFLKSALLSGASWNTANIASLFAVSSIGLAIAFPVTQLGAILPVAVGALYFKEVRERRNLLMLFVAAAVMIVGAVILASSKN